MGKGIDDNRYRAIIKLLADARRAKGMSQTDVAVKLSRNQQFVSKYETGERRLDIVEFFDIASALGADGYDLLRRCL